MRLRPELLLFDAADGGLDVLDLVLEREHHLRADEVAALRRAGALPGLAGEALSGAEVGTADAAPGLPPELEARLNAELLVEGPTAAVLRQGCRFGRQRSHPLAPVVPALPAAPAAWTRAALLPDFVAAPWREPERWRRLAEDRIAGRVLLRLDSFMTPAAALALRDATAALPFTRLDSMYARGGCVELPRAAAVGEDGAAGGGEPARPMDLGGLAPVLEAFAAGPLHELLGDVMGQALPGRIFGRVWRLEPGDRIAVHKDGLHYVTTYSLGLTADWTAAAGGAIAFGHPVRDGLEVVERWLPHLGDLLLFRPTAVAWHAVEEVAAGTRMTLTGHYVSDRYPG